MIPTVFLMTVQNRVHKRQHFCVFILFCFCFFEFNNNKYTGTQKMQTNEHLQNRERRTKDGR